MPDNNNEKSFAQLLEEFAMADDNGNGGNDGGGNADGGGADDNKPKTAEEWEKHASQLEAELKEYKEGTESLLEFETTGLTDNQRNLLNPLYENLKAKNPLQKLTALSTVKAKVRSSGAGVNNARNNAPSSSSNRPKTARELDARLQKLVKKK